jgi:hypothetical protein
MQIVGRKPNKDPGEFEAYAATMAKVGDALTAAAAGLLATPNAQVRRSSSSSSSAAAAQQHVDIPCRHCSQLAAYAC